jgi:hypothetical protein
MIDPEYEDCIKCRDIQKVYTYSVDVQNIIDDKRTYISSTAWGNGEGVDVNITYGTKESILSLTYEECYGLQHVLETMINGDKLECDYKRYKKRIRSYAKSI